MPAPTTFVTFLLDMSGSMGPVAAEAIGGYNQYLDSLRKAPGDGPVVVTLTLFDTVQEIQYVARPLGDVSALTADVYQPRGATALYDAIGATVRAVDRQATFGDRILVVILTDGQENASREYDRHAIKALIERKQAAGNWTFAYVMAGPDAFAKDTAVSYGILAANAAGYHPDRVGTRSVMDRLAGQTVAYAASAAPSSNTFFDPADAATP